MTSLALNYVAAATRDVAAVCRFLGDSLGYSRIDLEVAGQPIAFFAVGRAAVGVFPVDHPYLESCEGPGIHHIGLQANDPMAVAAAHDLPIAASGTGPAGHVYGAIDRTATCGIHTYLIDPVTFSPANFEAAHDPGGIDHLGVASTDIDACRRRFVDDLGFELESTETDVEVRQITESFVSDKYGAVYQSRTPEILGGLRAVFINIGDCELEVMMDYDPTLSPLAELGQHEGNTKGDQSAIANFIARRGPGLAHLAFETRDIDALMARLAADGWRLIDHVGRPGGRASRIAFVHPSNFGGGLLLHFVEPRHGG